MLNLIFYAALIFGAMALVCFFADGPVARWDERRRRDRIDAARFRRATIAARDRCSDFDFDAVDWSTAPWADPVVRQINQPLHTEAA